MFISLILFIYLFVFLFDNLLAFNFNLNYAFLSPTNIATISTTTNTSKRPAITFPMFVYR